MGLKFRKIGLVLVEIEDIALAEVIGSFTFGSSSCFFRIFTSGQAV